MASQKQKEVATIHDGAVYIHVAGTPVYRKTADICAMTGKSNQWVGQLTSQGAINKRKTPHGMMYDDIPTLLAYCQILETRAKDAAEKALSPEYKERSNAEISIKKSKAIKAGLEAKELMGKMHRSDDIEFLVNELLYAMRNMILALPGRLAIDVANITDPAEASERIRAEVFLVLEEMCNYEYDPKKYEEMVRERMNWDEAEDGVDDDG